MELRAVHLARLAALAAVVCACRVHAGEGAGDACATPPADGAMPDRTGTIAWMQQLPEACLKQVMRECNRASAEHVLDFGTAALCSMNYEALLRKSFGGNFQAMLAWWRQERAEAAVQ